MKKIYQENKQIIKVAIETTIHELYDMKDALDNSGQKVKKMDALQRTIDSYEKLRRDFLSDKLTEFNDAQIEAILKHRLAILEKRKKQVDFAIEELSKLVNLLGTDIN